LPLACAVTNPSKDLGLVLVYPNTGKITYWENIDSAESLKLFDRRRQGVEGTLRLSSSEYVVEILNTENAGLVLLTSSGRLAHVTLQDSYGNPHITANFLYGGGKGSFFGDLVNVFGKRNLITSVKSRQVTKGRVEIIALEEDGVFKVWETSESSQPNFVGDYDFSQMVRTSLAELGMADGDYKFGLKFLDFSQVRRISHEVLNDAFALHCIIVAQVELPSKSQLVVLEAMITSSRQSIDRIFPISVHESNTNEEYTRMLFSANEETIFITQGLSIVVLSWPLPKETVEDEPVRSVHYYEDCINFSAKRAGQILSVCAEENSHSGTQSKRAASGILLFTKSAGMLRITPNVYNPKIHTPTAESKLEQRVFFGGLVENSLDLNDLSSFSFGIDDMETAALRLSTNILRTGIDFLPQSAAAMEPHLTLRMKALQDLAAYLKAYYPNISRSTKWKLLFDAEKLAAARAIWRRYDKKTEDKGRKEVTLLDEAVDVAIERHKDDDNPRMNDGDDARLWFIKHVHNLEKLFPICFGLIKAKNRAEDLNTKHLLRLAQEMNDLVVSTLGAAFDFRQRNVSIYGLENEDLDDGILSSGYEGLPKFWTSDSEMTKAVSWSIDLSHEVVTAVLSKAEDSKNMSSAIVKQANHLAVEMDEVVKLSCRSYMEGYRWLMAQDSIEDRNKGLDMKTTFETKIRRDQIVALYDMGQGQRGLALAEELEDVSALVELSLLELDEQKANRSITIKSKSKSASSDGLDHIEKQIAHYFRKFGKRFARPFYEGQVSSHRLADLIDKDLGLDDQRTSFLRSEPSFAKLSWINEAVNENDLVQVGHSLLEVAKLRESNTWSKGLELSLAKLALRSVPGSREPSVAQNEVEISHEAILAQQLLQRNEREISIWKVQQQLFIHIRPTVLEAVDEEGALDNIMKTYATETSKTHPALAQLLKLGFSDLVSHRTMSPDSLIDVLTLMDQVPSEESSEDLGVFGRETNLALNVLNATDLEPETTDTLQRLIWKRCLLRNDWAYLGKTNYKSDRNVDEKLMSTAAFETIKAGIKEGKYQICANIRGSFTDQ
jgi:nuclear pore complex protein Nup133